MKPMAMKNVEPGPKSNNFDSATPFENSSYTTRLGNRYDNIHYHYSVPVFTHTQDSRYLVTHISRNYLFCFMFSLFLSEDHKHLLFFVYAVCATENSSI